MKTIPKVEPVSINAGDTVKWTKYFPDYLPIDGWVLSYAFVQDGSQKAVIATDNGDGSHLVTITAADSAAYSDGIYYWQAYVTGGGERYKVGDGRVEVKPDFAGLSAGFDARSHVRKVLDALEATILGKASKDQMAYSIAGRSLNRMAPEELIKWQSHYQRMYSQELQQEKINNGLGTGNKIRVRF